MLSERETIEILRDIALTGGEREARRAVRMMREIWAKSPEPNPSPAPFPLSTVGWPEPGVLAVWWRASCPGVRVAAMSVQRLFHGTGAVSLAEQHQPNR